MSCMLFQFRVFSPLILLGCRVQELCFLFCPFYLLLLGLKVQESCIRFSFFFLAPSCFFLPHSLFAPAIPATLSLPPPLRSSPPSSLFPHGATKPLRTDKRLSKGRGGVGRGVRNFFSIFPFLLKGFVAPLRG